MDTIKTKRLELRPLELSHAALLLPIWSDEEVVKNTYVHSIYSEIDCQNRIERMIKNSLLRNDFGPYVILAEKKLIGIVGAARDSAFEFGLAYHLGKDYWGQGYATEAAKAVLESAFSIPEIVRVSADALTTNPASSRVLEKVGMKFEGCLRMKFHRNGVFGDLNTYSILRSEYTAK
jgi:Acetyltransferases, including N-acetylases of ribosomal proteins